VEVDDIAESSVSEGRAIDLDVILPAPVVDGVFMIDLLADFVNNHTWCPNFAIFFLFFVTLLHNRHKPSLKFFIII